MLLLVGTILGVRGEIVLSPDYAVVNDVWFRWVLVAGPDHDLLSRTIDLRPDWSIHAMNLTFDPRVVPCESSERVHIGPDLLVHEGNVLSDDVIKGFAHNISRAQRCVQLRGTSVSDGLVSLQHRLIQPVIAGDVTWCARRRLA